MNKKIIIIPLCIIIAVLATSIYIQHLETQRYNELVDYKAQSDLITPLNLTTNFHRINFKIKLMNPGSVTININNSILNDGKYLAFLFTTTQYNRIPPTNYDVVHSAMHLNRWYDIEIQLLEWGPYNNEWWRANYIVDGYTIAHLENQNLNYNELNYFSIDTKLGTIANIKDLTFENVIDTYP